MAGMFFTMQEVVEKLSKSEEQIHELIQEGKLREFRDGTKLLFKVSEVDALASQLPSAASGEPVEILPNDSEVTLEAASGPTPPAVPTPSAPELEIDEDDSTEPGDDLLEGDFSLDEAEDELTLEDSLSLLDSEDVQDAPVEEAADSDSGDTMDLLLTDDAGTVEDSSDDSMDLLLDDDVETVEEPTAEADSDETMDVLLTDDAETVEDTGDDSMDLLLDDDAETVEEISEEPAADADSDDTMDVLLTDDADAIEDTTEDADSDETMDVLLTDDEPAEDEGISIEQTAAPAEDFDISDESSSDAILDDGDSLKLVETAAPEEAAAEEDDFDLGDSFDILMEDDGEDAKTDVSEDSLLSNDTLDGLMAPDSPKVEGSDDELLSSLTKADTAMGNTGINVLAESDSDYQLASDTKADTVIPDDDDDDDLSDLDDLDMSDDDFLGESAGLGNLDDDLNLDSIGSGSGLLDLSLQADDTSLGAVLDDILPSEDEVEATPDDLDLGGDVGGDDEDDVFEPEPEQISEAIPAAPAGVRYAQAEATAVDKACGVAMFLPALMVVYSAIILLFGIKGISPMLLTKATENMAGFPLIWWVVIGSSVVFLVILMFAALLGGGSSGPKEKKAKTKKPKKPKKPKKAKKKK